MKSLTSGFDKNGSSAEKAKAKMQVLSKQIDVQKKYIDQLNQKYDRQKAKLNEIGAQYEKVAAEQGETSAEAQKLAKAYTEQDTALQKTQENINKATSAMNNMQTEMQQLESEGGRLTLAQKFEQIGQKVEAAGQKVKAVGDKLQTFGKGLTTTVTMPIVGAAAAGVKKFAEVDKTMQLTNKTMGNSAEQADMLNQAMKDAASNSTFGMSDAAQASLNFARAGLTAEEAASALAPAMNLAAGEGGELDTVSAGLVATINGFHGSFDEAGNYADVFAAACNNSALDVNSLSSAMSIAAPVFSAAGYSVNDAALYMGVMANAGIDADKAANSLKTGLARLTAPTKEAQTQMDALGISVTNADGSMKDSTQIQQELHDAFSGLSESEQLAAASAIFGKQQMAPWLALINTAPEDVDSLNQSLETCSGTTDEMADAMMSGFGGGMEKLKSTLDVLATTVGERLAPHIQTLADKIQDLADKFNSLTPEQQDKIIKIAGVIAALGPALLILGKVTSGVGTVMTTFGKLGGMVGKLSSLGKAGGEAGGGLSKLGDAASKSSSPVSSAGASFGTLAGQALKMIAAAAAIWIIAQAFKVLVDAAIQLANAGGLAIGVMAGMVAAIAGLMALVSVLGPGLTAAAPGILAFGAAFLMISGGIALVTLAVTNLVNVVAANAPALSMLIMTTAMAINSTITTIASSIVAIITTIAFSINSVITTLALSISTVVTSIGTTVSGVITSISNGITQVIDAISGGVMGILDSLSGVFDSIGQAALDAGHGFKVLADAVINLVNSTGALDLAATMGAVASGISKINKASGDSTSAASNLKSLGNSFRQFASGIVPAINTARSAVMTGMTSIVNVIRSAGPQAGSATNSMRTSVRTGLNGVVQEVYNANTNVSRALATLVSAFSNVSFNIPRKHIAVPHWSLSGSFDVKNGTVPTVKTSWYDKGGIFYHPSIIGVGEKRPEFVGALDDLRAIVREETNAMTVNVVVNGAQGQDENVLADAVISRLEYRVNRARGAWA